LEVVVLGILHGVDASFDTATDGLHGVAHSKSVRCWCRCVKEPPPAKLAQRRRCCDGLAGARGDGTGSSKSPGVQD
jgi:hypothetical protein